MSKQKDIKKELENLQDKEVFEWLKKVFPDEQLLFNFLKYAKPSIANADKEKIFPIYSASR